MFIKLKKKIKKALIKNIIWDFDGTLYQEQNLVEKLRDAYRIVLSHYKGRIIENKEFEELSRKHGSWAALLSFEMKIPRIHIINSIDKYFDKTQYIKKNEDLVKKIESLKKYKHIILSNSTEEQVKNGLKKIGFQKKYGCDFYPFRQIVGRNSVKYLKPSLSGFKSIHEQSKFPKISYLSIGDSYEDDIKPAKEYGLQAIHINEISEFFKI